MVNRSLSYDSVNEKMSYNSECFEEIYYQRTYSYRTTVMHFKIDIECSTIGGRGRS